MRRGFIKLHRKILETSFFMKPNCLVVAIYLLLCANYKEKKRIFNERETTVLRGELITGRKVISEETGLKESSVRRALVILERTGFIDIKTTNRFSRIKIVKYCEYQDGIGNNTSSVPSNEHEETTYKETNNSKELEKDKLDTLRVFDHKITDFDIRKLIESWNKKTKGKLDPVLEVSPSLKENIIKRLSETPGCLKKEHYWALIIDYIVNNKGMTGEKNYEGKKNKDWKASFGWLMRDCRHLYYWDNKDDRPSIRKYLFSGMMQKLAQESPERDIRMGDRAAEQCDNLVNYSMKEIGRIYSIGWKEYNGIMPKSRNDELEEELEDPFEDR